MKLEIIKQEKNPFLEREEYTLKISNDVTPSFEEIKNELKKDINLTVIKKVNANFGKQSFITEAVVYDNTDAKNKVEVIPKKIRIKMAKEAEEAAKKAAAEAKAAKEAEEAAKANEAETESSTEESQPEEANE